MKKRKNSTSKSYLARALIFLIKIPYFIIKGILRIFLKSKEYTKKRKVMKKRASLVPSYEDFSVLEDINNSYKEWEDAVLGSESKIGIILGARGSGKTAFGMKFLENYFAKTKKKCFSLGFNEEELPYWIKNVNDISRLENDSFVLIDEGGILFSSRKSMSNANKILSDLILIARHKNLNILFISQNSSNLDINILRQADFLIMKPSSLLQKNFERKIIQKIYEETSESFERFRDVKGLTYIYSDIFKGFISNPLPSFWSRSISKSFR